LALPRLTVRGWQNARGSGSLNHFVRSSCRRGNARLYVEILKSSELVQQNLFNISVKKLPGNQRPRISYIGHSTKGRSRTCAFPVGRDALPLK
jgi:hypothetical protein